jgi:crossover junction endodeoxyribonuclease RuvC
MDGQTVILGVDPGFSVTGYAILKKDGSKALLLDYGFLKMSSQKSLVERVGIFYQLFQAKVAQHGVTEIALETSFLGKNAQTFLKLGYLRGILYLLAAQGGLPVNEFAPREVKCTVTGYGAASKDQVAAMVMRLFPRLGELGPIERQDVTDAMAVCLCGFWRVAQHRY